ncbi:MAG: hypothetical protein M3P96_01875 [Actinomycetota bacterium]|nr:hypothetical protein [Actinomycetota bacterium]
MTSQDSNGDPATIAAEESVVARGLPSEGPSRAGVGTDSQDVSPAADATTSVDDPAADAAATPARTRD